ncbi:T9SS type A sorting domain-containing protein [Flavobacterium sp.]|uniref:T9SS type A sorting domain-containing protein n=1 Tax=Flavobacterium sp. TaxID=239 RepID=UPI0026025D79|nr:T9SS type A sorting domain-containing protein [Flavobacterium sp.]
MRKKLLLLLVLLNTMLYAQKTTEFNDDFLNNIFDNYGNRYSLQDLQLKKDRNQQNESRFIDNTCDSGIFRLHFDTGSGMIDGEHVAAAARRAVVCQVFHDISEFLNTPLKTNGLNNRVEIWVRNSSALVGTNILGQASGFYSVPLNPTAANVNGGIIDNEIWKTIQTGLDSYRNIASSFSMLNFGEVTNSGSYFHGMLLINPSINWNLDLSANPPPLTKDLYTVVLHEVTHALGIVSLIDANGNSTLGNGSFNYYTRYDTFLRDSNGINLITNNTTCEMYNYTFTNNVNILHPNCSNPSGLQSPNIIADETDDCNTTIRFNNLPVYRPTCFENGSSLSHFEDECFTNSIGLPNGDNNYFVMSNALANNAKRFLTPEERNVLCQLGYTTNQTYSINGNEVFDYGNGCQGIRIAGVNDGLDLSTGNYLYRPIQGQDFIFPIATNNILNNDISSSSNIGFTCLEDVYDINAYIPTTSGNATTTVIFNSSQIGLHLLRYIPIDLNTNELGNITYIYLFVETPNVHNGGVCDIPPSVCNLVRNGDFEFFEGLSAPNLIVSPTGSVCFWNRANNGTPDYFRPNHPYINNRIPCNSLGDQEVNSGNSYIGIGLGNNANENISTLLNETLLPNTEYTLTFNVSLADGLRRISRPIQVYLRNGIQTYPGMADIPLINNTNELLINTSAINDFSGWTTITLTFNTGNRANLNALYIGGFNTLSIPNTINPINSITTNCTFTTYNNPSGTYYYLDNVRLVRKEDSNLNLPVNICLNETLNNLNQFIELANLNGTFTGNGVTGNTFDATTAGIGIHTITYTYQNNLGCEMVITDTIEVLPGNNAGTLSGNQNIFTNQTTTITSTETGGTWSSSDTSIATVDANGVVTPITASVVSILYTDSNSPNCPPDVESIIITIQDLCQNATSWNGTSWSNGTPSITTYVEITGDYDMSLNTSLLSFDACRVRVVSPARVVVAASKYVNINYELVVESGATFEVNDDASLVQINNQNNNQGNIIYHRDVMVNQFDYVYWSSPISNFNINNLSPATSPSLIFRWNPNATNPNGSSGYWINANNSIMEAGKGYIIRVPMSYAPSPDQNFTATFSNGIPNNGIIHKAVGRGDYVGADIPISNSSPITSISDNFNLIGNPYPSAIDPELFLDDPDNINVIDGCLYLWKHGIGLSATEVSPFYASYQQNYSVNDYDTYNSTGTQSGPGVLKVAGGQGFFVIMKDEASTVLESGNTHFVTFRNEMRDKTFNNNNFYRNSNVNSTTNPVEKHRIWLDLANSNNESIRTLIGYVTGATMLRDRSYDAPTQVSNLFSFYSLIGNEKLNIQGRSLPFDNNDIVPIGMNITANGNYTFAIYTTDGIFNQNQNIYIYDSVLDSYHNIKVAPYTFYATVGRYDDRFKVVYKLPTPTFDEISPVCNGTTINALPTISNNGILGSWSPAINNTQTTTYTFTPNEDVNNTTTLTINILQGTTYYQDSDNDGYGNPNVNLQSCEGAPSGYVTLGTDCDDTNNLIHPNAVDVCYDGIDNDCNGIIDNSCVPITGSLPTSICGTTLSGWYSTITANWTNFAQGYRFKITKVDMVTNEPLAPAVIVDRPVNNISLANVPGTTYNSRYMIEIAVKYNNVWQPFYGPACFVNTPNPVATIGTHCGSTLTAMNQWIYTSPVSNVTAYKFRVTRIIDGVPTGISQETTQPTNRFNMTQLSGILYNCTYKVEVSLRNTDGTFLPYNVPCNVTTPNIPIPQIECVSTNLAATNSYINAYYLSSAMYYRFVVENLSTNQIGIYDSTTRQLRLTGITNYSPVLSTPFVTYNTSYKVKVAILPSANEVGEFSSECIFTTPPFPVTQLQTSQCNYTANSNTEYIYANIVSGVSQYKFRLTNTSLGYSQFALRPLRAFSLNMFTGLQSGTTYSVDVSVLINGIWGPFGNACNITTPGSIARTNTPSTLKNSFDVKVVPNPFSENFEIKVTSPSNEILKIKVFDNLGRLLDDFESTIENLNQSSIGNKYLSGVYNIIIQQNDEVKTLKVIKR